MSIGFPSPATTAFAPFVAIPLRAGLRMGLAGLLLLATGSTALSAESQPWLTFPAQPGPGNGKHLVFVSGDEEYRSEESLPMLAAMLAQRHGFRCTVLFAIHPQTGAIDPNTLDNIPGLHALTNADLMVICTRFRQLPDAQMAFVDGYLSAAKPVIGIRPAVVAFRNPAGSTYFKYSYDNRAGDYRDGFGLQVLGSTWISHHGAHGKESTQGLPVEAMKAHPILRGVGPMWGPSDVYTIRTPIPRDGEVLVMGQVLTGMKPDDPPSPKPQMPLAWTTRYTTPQGTGRVFMTTLGASQDFADENLRRLFVNACYWAVGLEAQIRPAPTSSRSLPTAPRRSASTPTAKACSRLTSPSSTSVGPGKQSQHHPGRDPEADRHSRSTEACRRLHSRWQSTALCRSMRPRFLSTRAPSQCRRAARFRKPNLTTNVKASDPLNPTTLPTPPGADPQLWREFLHHTLQFTLKSQGAQRTGALVGELGHQLYRDGVAVRGPVNTPYLNTLPAGSEPPYPGDRELERRIKSYIRWNAMAMVVKANSNTNVGGHISTYASSATLYEVAFNHFLRGRQGDFPGDMAYFQGHASPGIYARAFLERRLDERHLKNFRQELAEGGGLSSYPHPYLMPDFWQFPTVSMGLGPIMSIYQARFNRYARARGFLKGPEPKVWCFIGDGESDEPETLGSLTLASREGLDNLIWVVNCNLQRLDGPVRGNGKIIQELEAAFLGAGWNVNKVIWGSDWDPIIAADTSGQLLRRMEEVVDGEYQKYSVEPGSYTRKHFFGKYPELLKLVNHLTDEQITKLRRGGHDPRKVYAAYHAAMHCAGKPTVIIAKTVKGYGLGEAGEGRNITHQQKKLNEKELRGFRERFGVPISDDEIAEMPFYRPPQDSAEGRYLTERREALGGPLPARFTNVEPLPTPKLEVFAEFFKGSGTAEASTTMGFVRLLGILLRQKEIGRRIVPIIPDEARTFGMDALFREIGIYSSKGQLYEPVDIKSLLYYLEKKDGQILEEGITEAGSMSSFIAAGTSYASLNQPMIPFYTYYSMFGFQRVGDLIWLAGDIKAKGFLLGATSGRTTLNGEGLQHQDAHSLLLASTVPTLMAYDPAFAYETAVIVADGLERMYAKGEDVFYYLALYNENHVMPPMPEGAPEGILKGLYKFKAGPGGTKLKAQILGSGPLLINSALKAQAILADRYGVSADVWSATSYKALRNDALRCQRWNMLHPTEPPRVSYLQSLLAKEKGPFIAVSDNLKLVPDQIAPWVPGGLTTLGTDGFGRSDTRARLRRFFEVDAESTVIATLWALAQQGQLKPAFVARAMKDLGVEPEKVFPQIV